jgi:alpha-galactosidase
VAKDEVLFLNYANPMAMNTWAALDYGGVETVGLCHGVQGAHYQIASVIEHWARKQGLLTKETLAQLQEDTHLRRFRREVDVVAAGINHQTWFIKVLWRGMDMTPRLPELFAAHPTFPQTEKVRIDVLQRFGYYSTESNGHFSEYVPWYRKRPQNIRKWIDLSSWINGETGGYLRVCTEGRNWFKTDFPRWLAEAGQPLDPDKRSLEHGSYIIEARETGRPYRGHLNVRNGATIMNLPPDCIVEVPCWVDHHGISVPRVGDLPLACAATCAASVSVQRMAKEAAMHGDVTLLKQAMLHDPLVGAVCEPDEVWQMADEMLLAQARWLPQYVANGSIAAAQKRLAKGPRVKTKAWAGAARLKVRSVAELRKDRETSVLAADKAAAQRAKDAAKARLSK